MAGAFGALREKYELSLKVAEPLMQKIRASPMALPSSPPAQVADTKSRTWPRSGPDIWRSFGCRTGNP